MRSTLACVRLRECTLACSMELRGNTCNSASICCAVPTPCSEIFLQVFPRKPRTQAVLHGVVNMQLPNQWLWDMVDEFVYQFQSFCQYQAKMKTKTEQEISLLKQFDQAWSVYGVLNFLQALVEKSMIVPVLEQEKEGLEKFTADAGYDYNGGSNVLKVLGYFSMVGLLRVHCLLGDYQTGLKCLLPIDISHAGVYTVVIGSHIATIYHYGFANLMLRRYVKVILEFNKILLYIYQHKQYYQKLPQYDQIIKKNEQMYALLAVSLSLCPQMKLVKEIVNSQFQEKYNEKMLRMQRCDDESFVLMMNSSHMHSLSLSQHLLQIMRSLS